MVYSPKQATKCSIYDIRELLKTSVFRSFRTLWRKLHLSNSICYKKLGIFSEEPLKTLFRFLEVPIIFIISQSAEYDAKNKYLLSISLPIPNICQRGFLKSVLDSTPGVGRRLALHALNQALRPVPKEYHLCYYN